MCMRQKTTILDKSDKSAPFKYVSFQMKKLQNTPF